MKIFLEYLKNNNIAYEIINNNLTVGGGLDLEGTAITSLPDNLTVGGDLYLRDTAITSLPDNLTVGGGLDLRGTAITSLPDNLTVGGYLDLEGTAITSLPDNLTVGGDLYLRDTAITSLPDNLTVGGYLDLEGTAITSLPDNLTVGGDLYLRDTAITSLPDNLTVGGGLDLRDTAITSLPDNLTVGGYLDLRGTAINNNTKVNNIPKDFYIMHRNYIESKLIWQNGKYRKIDNIFCEVIKQNKNILTIKIRNKKAYIFSKNGVNAHGNTVKQAYFDWLFKTSDRNIDKYKNLKHNDKNTLDFWIIAYRTITGACSFGTNNYLENNKDKYKAEMTLKEVIKATEGQYGHNTFKEFFNEK